MSALQRMWVEARSRAYVGVIELRKRGWFWPAAAVAALVLIGLIILLWPVIWFLLKVIFFLALAAVVLALVGWIAVQS